MASSSLSGRIGCLRCRVDLQTRQVAPHRHHHRHHRCHHTTSTRYVPFFLFLFLVVVVSLPHRSLSASPYTQRERERETRLLRPSANRYSMMISAAKYKYRSMRSSLSNISSRIPNLKKIQHYILYNDGLYIHRLLCRSMERSPSRDE